MQNPLGSLMTKVSERWNSQTSLEVTENQNGEIVIEKKTKELQQEIVSPSATTSTIDQGHEEKGARKSDLAKALDTDLSKLDAMIEQAEIANYTMAHQSRQIKSFLK